MAFAGFFPSFPLTRPTISLLKRFYETGISSFDVSLENQTADVYTHDGEEGVSYEQVLEKIKKTGKAVTKGERDGVVAAI